MSRTLTRAGRQPHAVGEAGVVVELVIGHVAQVLRPGGNAQCGEDVVHHTVASRERTEVSEGIHQLVVLVELGLYRLIALLALFVEQHFVYVIIAGRCLRVGSPCLCCG